MITLCRTLLRGIASACLTRSPTIASAPATQLCWTNHHSIWANDARKPLQQLLQQQTYTPQQLTAWLADGGLHDPAAMQVIESNAKRHVDNADAALLLSPRTLCTQLQHMAINPTLLRKHPATSKLLYMCTLTTMKQASAQYALLMTHSCSGLGLFDRVMAQTLLHNVASVTNPQSRMYFVCMALKKVSEMKAPWVVDEGTLAVVGAVIQQDLEDAPAETLSIELRAFSFLGQVPSNLDLSAMVDWFIVKLDNAHLASTTLAALVNLEQLQLLKLNDEQCRAYGLGLNNLLLQMNTFSLVATLRAMTALGSERAALMGLNQHMLRASIDRLLDKFTAAHVGDMLKALHTLQLHPVKDLQLHPLRLGQSANAGLADLHMTNVCTLLEACRALKLHPVKQLSLDLPKLGVAVANALDGPLTQALTKTLRALHRLRIHPVDHLQLSPARTGLAMNAVLSKADLSTTCSLLIVLASLKLNPKTQLRLDMSRLGFLIRAGVDEWDTKALSAALFSVSMLRVDPVKDLGIDLQRLGQAIDRQMHECTLFPFTMMLVSLAFMRVHPVKDLGLDPAMLGQYIKANMASWTPIELANILRALAMLQLDPVEGLGLDRQEWEEAISNTVADKALQNNFTLSETLWSLGKMEEHYQTRMPWAGVAEQIFQSLDLEGRDVETSQRACVALHGCVKLHYRPPNSLLDSLVGRIAEGIVHGEPKMAMVGARALMSCFHLAWLPSTDTLQTMVTHIVDHSSTLESRTTQASTLYAIVGLLCMYNKRQVLERLMPQLRKLVVGNPGEDLEVRQVKVAQLACRVMDAGELVPEHVAPAYAQPVEPTLESLGQSILQDRVAVALESLGVFAEVRSEFPVLEGTTYVDVMCTMHDGTRVVVEVNGPYHFFVNKPISNGATRFKNALLTQQGYVVVPMHHGALQISISNQEALCDKVLKLLRRHGVEV